MKQSAGQGKVQEQDQVADTPPVQYSRAEQVCDCYEWDLMTGYPEGLR